MFRIFDSDGSGSISLVEMTNIVSHLYHLIPDKERVEVGTPEQAGLEVSWLVFNDFVFLVFSENNE